MIVTSIYIEVEYTQPDELFTADTTLVTADDTTHTADETLIASGETGLKYERIELFTDEIITINSTITNFNDIAKLFADFTKSFTIPASPHNNEIFKDWYESAMGENDPDSPINLIEGTAFDHRRTYNGYIEIDTIPFKFGKFTMQKSNVKNGNIDSYSINFTGAISQLNDKFKDDKLNTLNGYEAYNVFYTFPTISTRITEPNYDIYDVHFPLIGSDHKYEYLTANPNDITLTTGAIYWADLFPSLKLPVILNLIQSTYGITFTGAFLNSTRIKNSELYCKNAEKMVTGTDPKLINWVSKSPFFAQLSLDDDRLSLNPLFTWYIGGGNPDAVPSKFKFKININTTSTNYNLIVTSGPFSGNYGTNTFFNLSGNQSITFFERNMPFTESYSFKFYISSDTEVGFSYDADLKCEIWKNYNDGTFAYTFFTANSATGIASSDLQIRKYIPDISVSDFITSFVKKYNLIIIPKNENTFEFKQLENWYSEGNLKDITEYITNESIDISRPNLYKRIDFKYQKSENILNNRYYTNLNQYYGDLWYDNPNSAFSESYEIELPFEDVMFERTTGTNFQTATMIDKNQNAYVPAPVILFNNGIEELSVDYYITNDYITFVPKSTYRRYSNEIAIGGTDLTYIHSDNWGVEVSSWYRENVSNGLYFEFYSNYILNLYNQRTRVINCKGVFNTNYISELKMNDRIILSNKRYVINTMNTNLSTGEVQFELLNDFRDISTINTNRYSNIPFLNIDNTEQVVQFDIYILNYDSFDVKVPTDFLSYTTSTDNTNDINLEVTIPVNTTGLERYDFVVLEYFKDGISTIINLPVIQAL